MIFGGNELIGRGLSSEYLSSDHHHHHHRHRVIVITVFASVRVLVMC